MNLDEVLDKHDELRRRSNAKDPALLGESLIWNCGTGRSIRLTITRKSELGAASDEFDYDSTYLVDGLADIPGSGRVDAQMISRHVLSQILQEANKTWPQP